MDNKTKTTKVKRVELINRILDANEFNDDEYEDFLESLSYRELKNLAKELDSAENLLNPIE